MINVLHIINGADLGGISSMILNYYKNIDRNAFHFDFIYSIDEPLGHNGHELEKLGANFFYVPKKSAGLKKHIDGIKKIIKAGNYDAIHVHSGLTSYVALSVAKKSGIKIRVAHAHNAVKNIRGLRNKLKRFLGNYLIKFYASCMVACSRDAAVYTFGDKSLKNLNLKILPNSIDSKKYIYSEDERVKIRKELNIGDKDFVIGSVGRMTPEKNQIFLLQVFKVLSGEDKSAKLLLVGDGPDKEVIKDFIKKEHLEEKVFLTGQRTDVNAILSSFDVYAMPSLYEGFPVAGLEAAANGLPIVLSDTITKELSFVKNIHYLSLCDDKRKWVDIIELCKGESRNDSAVADIIENGFDIVSSAKILQKIYSDKWR